MTPKPKTKADIRRRSSIIKSTKAQRARAEAIALKQDRLSTACNNPQPLFPKSPLPTHRHHHRSQDTHSNRSSSALAPRLSHALVPTALAPTAAVNKKTSNSFQRSISAHASTSRATLDSSTPTPSLLKKTKTLPTAATTSVSGSSRISVATPVPDRIARIQEAKQKANSYLRSNGNSKSSATSATKAPNFQKLHAQSFKNQKSITAIVKEVPPLLLLLLFLLSLSHFLSFYPSRTKRSNRR
jgi:hypothetical protein